MNDHNSTSAAEPCPGCGAEAILQTEDEYAYVRCVCGWRGPNAYTEQDVDGGKCKAEAIAAWNRRAPATQAPTVPSSDWQAGYDAAIAGAARLGWKTPAAVALTEERIAELNREAQDQGVSGIAPSVYLARAVERELGIGSRAVAAKTGEV